MPDIVTSLKAVTPFLSAITIPLILTLNHAQFGIILLLNFPSKVKSTIPVPLKSTQKVAVEI